MSMNWLIVSKNGFDTVTILDVDFRAEPSSDVMVPCRMLVALSAFTRRKYTRGLGPICAFLLRHVTEETAFWILCGLLTQRFPQLYSDFAQYGDLKLLAPCWAIIRGASNDGTSSSSSDCNAPTLRKVRFAVDVDVFQIPSSASCDKRQLWYTKEERAQIESDALNDGYAVF